MSSAKLAIACALVAVGLSACGGTKPNPEAGTIPPGATSAGRAKLDDPRSQAVACLKQDKIPYTESGRVWIQIGSPPGGPKVQYVSTPGAAQWTQIDGQAPGAEVIGGALLYPEQGSDQLLSAVESCLAIGVSG